ncbi:MAG: tetratricopeptide (TPR) repeat protein [Bacteroidia bacterium]|jgi:tetratricopeptide (TPR) repeat protein
MTPHRNTPPSVNPPSCPDPPSLAPPSSWNARTEGVRLNSSKQARIANLERLITAARDHGDHAEYDRLVDQQARFCGSISALEELADTYPVHRTLESIAALDTDRSYRTRQLLETARQGGLRSPHEVEIMARCYFLLGDFGLALDMFDELLEASVAEGHIHRYRGLCLLSQGAWVLAQYAFEDALADDSECGLSLRGKGEALIQVGPAEQAIHFLRKALRKLPRDAHTYFLLGDALYSLGHVSEASVAYTRSVRLAPLNKRNIHRHARTLMQLGRAVEAVQVLDAAHEQDLSSTPGSVERKLWSEALHRERRAASDQAARAEAVKPKPRVRHKRRNLIKRWLSKSLYPY